MNLFKYINLKVTPAFHLEVKLRAAEQGISMTEFINNAINKKPPEKKSQKEPHLQTYPEPTPPKDIFEPNYNPQPKKK